MKKPQTALLTMQSFSALGSGIIGIFFLFFVQENFSLEFWEVIAWFAVLQLACGILAFPVNYWGIKFLGVRKMIQIGLFSNALFFAILGLEQNGVMAFWILNVSFVLFLLFFWPAYHFLTIHATQDNTRGKFLGNIQAMLVSIGIVAPLITGYLLEIGQARWVLAASVLCFGGGILCGEFLPPTKAKMYGWKTTKHMLETVFFKTGKHWAFWADAAETITMWILWPIYFKVVVGTYTVMGAITAFTAFLEIFTAKYIGKKTDEIGAKRMLFWGVWARFLDLSLRAIYMKFNALPVVLGIQSLGTVFGPIFQISAASRIYDVGEAQKDKLFNYLVIREMFLGIGRAVWLAPTAVLVYYAGPLWIGIVFILAGLSAFGFRKL